MIRRIEEKDIKPVENILKEVFNTTFPQENPFCRWFILEVSGKINGFLCYSVMYEQLEINYIYVNPEVRHQKMATSLMEEMIEEAKVEGIKTMTLEVNEHNIAAQELYKKFGFVVGAVRKQYYGNENGLLMVRKLM